ncbi:DNA-3-methyladenine glycosylase II [Rhizobium sp. NFR07]|uniref:DNA-3-methyladenine glycosylase family protein n=1 Tax=Rhizobium sp. NFR07 TaxID=1566262 RepID=UPI0008ECF745|nr:DNA-3-methyladenine glycosylase [Rhizobium sp. NFR07]SFB23820.1 DNA-3-methyladenine glycosylase II [Rhizobium sp. NFR07]
MRIITCEADVAAGLEQLLLLDTRLAPIAELAGPLPLRLSEPGFAGLASIIVSQMVSRASADAIWRRIAAAGPVTAPAYAALGPDVIATFGLSRAKAATLMALSQAVLDETVDLHGICELDGGEAMKRLTSLPGIGPWTAQVYLMFCAGHPDVFPSGDVALQASVGRAFGMDTRPDSKALAAMAAQWAPHRSIAARLFWAYYAVAMRRNGLPIA